MAESLTVVGNAPYPVALESGRHLHPGEVAEVQDSERVQQQLAERQLALVDTTPPSEPSTPPATNRPSSSTTQKEPANAE